MPPTSSLRRLARRTLPLQTRVELVRRWQRATAWPPVGKVRFGSLRRSTPISRAWGRERGTSIDRYYIDEFLRRHAGMATYAPGAIRGRVLEVADDLYATRFGGDAVERVDVVDHTTENPKATLIADLTRPGALPEDTYDCVICTQTLTVIYDVRAVVRNIHRTLKPGGTALVTVGGIAKISRPDMDVWGDYWRFTSLGARRLFEEVFDPADITVESFGNVLTATAFLYGLAAEDLRREELELNDPEFQVTVALRAIKRGP